MKIFAASFCFGLLPLLSVIILLESVHGRPYLAQEHKTVEESNIHLQFLYQKSTGNELFPDKGDLNHEELLLALLNKNFDFQRPSKKDVELDNKLEEFNQTEELKRQLTKEKQAKIFYAINDLFPSHPNKPACFWKYCV